MSAEASVPREEIPWYPKVNFNECIGCGQCVEFCHNDVYGWDEENNHPIVVNPHNCVVGCSACAKLCPQGAISFPSKEELLAAIRAARERHMAGNR